jgi:hypothetical protein
MLLSSPLKYILILFYGSKDSKMKESRRKAVEKFGVMGLA